MYTNMDSCCLYFIRQFGHRDTSFILKKDTVKVVAFAL